MLSSSSSSSSVLSLTAIHCRAPSLVDLLCSDWGHRLGGSRKAHLEWRLRGWSCALLGGTTICCMKFLTSSDDKIGLMEPVAEEAGGDRVDGRATRSSVQTYKKM
ncbi:hypothetical protein EJB05_14229 [Eragrostis curvula]|uniref:Uncharacterized protein n=1 Tax=Eragrostis curvula TaxID=38414 RepID=A0A5J9VYH3_9POAL|nr:hypothetical protein EJB05_14229 [Eragrostis curvula]